eukprot:9723989-Prorocentrum_lima.AAC.1
MGGSQALLHNLSMTTRRSVDHHIQPERAERFDPGPCWMENRECDRKQSKKRLSWKLARSTNP